jgi:hypothetical protein
MRKGKTIKRMSDKELRQAFASRSMMFSWVAFLDGESERMQTKYIEDAGNGISEIEKELTSREIKILCN